MPQIYAGQSLELWRDNALTQDGVRLMSAIAVAMLLSFYGLSKKSLSPSGATAALFVGGWCGTTLVLLF